MDAFVAADALGFDATNEIVAIAGTGKIDLCMVRSQFFSLPCLLNFKNVDVLWNLEGRVLLRKGTHDFGQDLGRPAEHVRPLNRSRHVLLVTHALFTQKRGILGNVDELAHNARHDDKVCV